MGKNSFIKGLSYQDKIRLIAAGEEYKLELFDLAYAYGQSFVFKLINLLIKNEKGAKKTGLIYPDIIKKLYKENNSEELNKEFDSYIEKIEDAGFKISIHKEIIIDEETEKSHIVKRYEIKYLKK